MNQTNLLDLRPLSIAELFDRSFRLYRNHFGTYLGIVLVTQLPVYVIIIILNNLLAPSADPSSEAFLRTPIMGSVFLFGLIEMIVGLIFTQIGAAALTKAISDSYLGQKTSFRNAFKRIGTSWVSLIVATILVILIIMVMLLPVYIITLIPCVGLILAIPLIIYIIISGNLLVSLIPPVIILEKKGIRASINRAWELSRLRFWWAFGYLLLLSILSLLIVSGPVALIQYLFETALGGVSPFMQSIVQQSADLLLSAIYIPVQITAITLMYFDLRIRFEGFDLMVLSAAADAARNDTSEFTNEGSL